MRKALIVLGVVALVLVALGAVNHGLLFDIDFVAATWSAVSLFWVAVVIAGIVVVTGVAAALLAQTGAVATRRRLEKELQGTYERLRAAEAKLPRVAPTPAPDADVASGEQTAVTAVASAPSAGETPSAEPAGPQTEAVVTGQAAEDDTVVTDPAPEAETVVTSAAQPGRAPDVAAGDSGADAEPIDQAATETFVTAADPAPAVEDAVPPSAS